MLLHIRCTLCVYLRLPSATVCLRSPPPSAVCLLPCTYYHSLMEVSAASTTTLHLLLFTIFIGTKHKLFINFYFDSLNTQQHVKQCNYLPASPSPSYSAAISNLGAELLAKLHCKVVQDDVVMSRRCTLVLMMKSLWVYCRSPVRTIPRMIIHGNIIVSRQSTLTLVVEDSITNRSSPSGAIPRLVVQGDILMSSRST